MEMNEERALEQLKEMSIHAKIECWIIEYDGKPLKMISGKSMWRRIGHAKNALYISFYWLNKEEVQKFIFPKVKFKDLLSE